MIHTEKYVLNMLKTIALAVLNKEQNGSNPHWNLTIATDKVIDEDIYQVIAISILGGNEEGELCQFIDEEREFVFWKLKINWKYAKPAFIFFNDFQIAGITKQE